MLTLAAVGVATWLAAVATLRPPADPIDDSPVVTYTVIEATVGRTLPFVARAQWDTSVLARSVLTGTVTQVSITPGQVVGQGETLFRVDNRPVVIGRGDTPAFRELTLQDKGPDVLQLQQMLVDLGYLEVEPDGNFGSGTRAAVSQWQMDHGLEGDGVLRHGDIIWSPRLPVSVAPGAAIVTSAILTGGEEAVLEVPGVPTFRIDISLEQRNLVPLDGHVEVEGPGDVWNARVVEAVEREDGTGVSLLLGSLGTEPICGSECAVVALDGASDYVARIVAAPETTGPAVPVSAIKTGPDGRTSVVRADGVIQPVVVVSAVDGIAVVDGLAVGDVVRVFHNTSED